MYTLTAESKVAYRLRRDREWLDPEEGVELRNLLAAYWSAGELPARVRRATWRAEYASWLMWGDVVIPMLTGGLEALLKTHREDLPLLARLGSHRPFGSSSLLLGGLAGREEARVRAVHPIGASVVDPFAELNIHAFDADIGGEFGRARDKLPGGSVTSQRSLGSKMSSAPQFGDASRTPSSG